MTGNHNKVEYCSGSHLKESSFRSKDPGAASGAESRPVVRALLDAPPSKSNVVLSHRCSNKPCIAAVVLCKGTTWLSVK